MYDRKFIFINMKTKKQKILEYNAVFQEEKDGGYSVLVPELPGCTSQGETVAEARKNIRNAIKLYLNNEPSKDFSGLAFSIF